MIQLPQYSGAVKSIAFNVQGARDLALVDQSDGVWVVVPIHYTKWYDFATLVWWFFCPADKKAVVTLNFPDRSVKVRAIRVATKHARVRGTVK
jgi:hypothetical protein